MSYQQLFNLSIPQKFSTFAFGLFLKNKILQIQMVSNHGSTLFSLFLESPHYFRGALCNLVIFNLGLVFSFLFLISSGISNPLQLLCSSVLYSSCPLCMHVRVHMHMCGGWSQFLCLLLLLSTLFLFVY